jgi:hypothetical protein
LKPNTFGAKRNSVTYDDRYSLAIADTDYKTNPSKLTNYKNESALSNYQNPASKLSNYTDAPIPTKTDALIPTKTDVLIPAKSDEPLPPKKKSLGLGLKLSNE